MPLLINRVLPLRTICLGYIARNLEIFWKEEWNPELQEVTEASDDILLNLPSMIRLEIFLYYCKNCSLNFKTLLLLLDDKTFSESLDVRYNTFYALDVRYVTTLLARRCVRSTLLSLKDLSFVKEPSFAQVLGTFTDLTSLRLRSIDGVIVKVIGTALHNLEQLYLDDLENDNCDDIKCLVTGCPKLRILHVQRGVTLESVEYLLLGLPNLMEFKHPLMIFVLGKIIEDGKADRVSAIRNLYIDVTKRGKFSETYLIKSAQMVMKHLKNITMLDTSVQYTFTDYFKHCKELPTLYVTVSTMDHLTELTWDEFSCNDTIVPILEAVGHQLRLLGLSCHNHSSLDVIDQCRNLRVLRISYIRFKLINPILNEQSYGGDLEEKFTPFQHLQEMHLTEIQHFHFKSPLFKSLLASPVLQELKLEYVPIFTDDIVKAAFSHVNHIGEQLAFTSLRKLRLDGCDSITKYLENVVTHDRVPLELLNIKHCERLTKKTLWNMERFDMDITIDLCTYDHWLERSESSDSDFDFDSDSLYDYDFDSASDSTNE